jgi:hypothetical protein
MAKAFSRQITGGKELQAKMRKLGPAATKAAAGSLFRSAEKIMTTSKEKFVPVDVGNLRASGHVALPEIKGEDVKVTLGYGGPAGIGNQGGDTNQKDVGYAVHVHENPDAWHRPPTQWKYLEQPMKDAEKEIVKDLGEDIDDALAGV